MGIKNLPNVINTESNGKAMKEYTLPKLKGHKVAVDASLLIHQTVIAIRSSGHDLKNSRGELTSHLNGILYKVIVLLEQGILPVFVFDGDAPDIKGLALDKRRAVKDCANKALEDLSDSSDEEYIKNFKRVFRPTASDITEATILLGLMGIPYIMAPGEADPVCAWLAMRYNDKGKRYVKGVASDDSDMLPLGAPYLFKDMLRFMNTNKPIKIISLKRTLVTMNLTMDMFVNLCVLLGTDYCDRIDKIGPKKSIALVRKHKNIEDILAAISNDKNINKADKEAKEKFKEQRKCMITAANYFKTAVDKLDTEPGFPIDNDSLELRQHKHYELLDFMCNKHNFDTTRIQNAIVRLKLAQQNLDITRVNTYDYTYYGDLDTLKSEVNNDVDFLSSDDESSEIVSKKSKKNKLIKKKAN